MARLPASSCAGRPCREPEQPVGATRLDAVVGVAAVEQVDPVLDDLAVRPAPTVDAVVAGAAEHLVVSGPGEDRVVLLLAVDDVVAAAADDPVATAAAAERVVAGAALDDVVVAPAVDPVRALAAVHLVATAQPGDAVATRGPEPVVDAVVELLGDLEADRRLLAERGGGCDGRRRQAGRRGRREHRRPPSCSPTRIPHRCGHCMRQPSAVGRVAVTVPARQPASGRRPRRPGCPCSRRRAAPRRRLRSLRDLTRDPIHLRQVSKRPAAQVDELALGPREDRLPADQRRLLDQADRASRRARTPRRLSCRRAGCGSPLASVGRGRASGSARSPSVLARSSALGSSPSPPRSDSAPRAVGAPLLARRADRPRRVDSAAQPTRPGTQSVPASGTLAIAAASSVSATMSSGSRLWTWDLPQARARVWASSTIARR